MKSNHAYRDIRLPVSDTDIKSALSTYTHSVCFDTVPTLHIPSTYDTAKDLPFKGLQVPRSAGTDPADLVRAVQRAHNDAVSEPFSGAATTLRGKKRDVCNALAVTPEGVLIRRDYPSSADPSFRGCIAQCSRAHSGYRALRREQRARETSRIGADTEHPARGPRTILCYIDGRPHTWPALDWAATVLARPGDHIVVVTSLKRRCGTHSPESWAHGYDRKDVLAAVKHLQLYVSLLVPADFPVRTTVEVALGRPGTVLAHQINAHHPHLLVMATKRTRRSGKGLVEWRGPRLLDRVGTRYPVPVCVVPAALPSVGNMERRLERAFQRRALRTASDTDTDTPAHTLLSRMQRAFAKLALEDSGGAFTPDSELESALAAESDLEEDEHAESSFNDLLNLVNREKQALRSRLAQMRAEAMGQPPDKLAMLDTIVSSSTRLCVEMDRAFTDGTEQMQHLRRSVTGATSAEQSQSQSQSQSSRGTTVVFAEDPRGSHRSAHRSDHGRTHSVNTADLARGAAEQDSSTAHRPHSHRNRSARSANAPLRKTRSTGSTSRGSGPSRRWSQGSGEQGDSGSGSGVKKKLSRFLPFGKF